ncbi:MAG: DUF4870 domain-containing protein [Gammaproteobacteria bacterium]|nr:DUF4870 domain-containing protein [Gammaproteobacteria bacterium]TVQ50327.1 MAG: DUF4870 domain-containing protein [Gammaproteobacteria bacterium]
MSEISEMPAGPPSKEERNWALLAHLSAVAGVLLAGLGMVLGPLVVWLLKREDSEFVADQAKEALNFNITMLLGYIVGVILIPILIGVVILPVLGLLHLVFMIVAMIRASEGQRYRYPFALRLVS